MAFYWLVAVGQYLAVAWMVVLLMIVPELIIRQVCHLRRVATAVVQCWDDAFLEADVVEVHGIAHLALHLVVDNTLEDQIILAALVLLARAFRLGKRVLGTDAPAFLYEIRVFEEGVQGRIQIDAHQITEILGVCGSKRVHGVVGGGEGVHEVLQRAWQHFKERIANGKISRST